MFAVGASAVDWLYQEVTGKKGTYGPLGSFAYTPLSPGLSILNQTCAGVSDAYRRHAEGQTDLPETAVEIVASLGRAAETAFPLASAIERVYAASKNTEDVKLWSMVRAQMDEKYAARSLHKNERTEYQKVLHVLFGGFNKAEKEQPQGMKVIR
jgi:hypothetical protein